MIDLATESPADAVARVTAWLAAVAPSALNIAGPRASEDAEIYGLATELLRTVLSDITPDAATRDAPEGGLP